MDRTIVLEKHIIESWGLWYLEWQAQTKERLRKQVKSPQAFVEKHLVRPKGESLGGDTSTRGAVLFPK